MPAVRIGRAFTVTLIVATARCRCAGVLRPQQRPGGELRWLCNVRHAENAVLQFTNATTAEKRDAQAMVVQGRLVKEAALPIKVRAKTRVAGGSIRKSVNPD